MKPSLRLFALGLLAIVLCLPASAQNRLKDKTEAATPAADDWLYLDGSTNGVRKLSPVYYQVRDADLTSLAAISSTGVLVYRSGANTWSTVTIGTGLQFSGGTLSNTATSFVWGQGTGTLSAQTDLQAALDAKAAAANGTHTGTTTIARADVTKLSIAAAPPVTLSNGQTMNLSNSYSVYPLTCTGATATIGFHSTPLPGVYRIDGISTYGAGTLRVSFPALIRPEQDIDTPISYLDIPATSTGQFTIWFYVDLAGFAKLQAVGDTITQRDPDAFHRSTPGEIAGLAPKATPVAADKIAGNDSQNGDVVRSFSLGSLPISSATQAALDGKANLSGGNTYTGTQNFPVVQVPKIDMASQTPSGTPDSGWAWLYMGSDNMPYVRTSDGVNIPFGVPPFATIALSDFTSTLTTGVKESWRAPQALTLLSVAAEVFAPSTSGAVTIDVKRNGTSIFSTLLTIDQDEEVSATAAVPAVLSTTAISANDKFTFEVTGAGTGAKGLKLTLKFR